MRITIEAGEHEQPGVSVPAHDSASAIRMDAMEGGSPSASLMQAVAVESLSPSTERKGIDGGSPPEWLLEAVEGASSGASLTTGDTCVDAGSAPS